MHSCVSLRVRMLFLPQCLIPSLLNFEQRDLQEGGTRLVLGQYSLDISSIALWQWLLEQVQNRNLAESHLVLLPDRMLAWPSWRSRLDLDSRPALPPWAS